MRRYGATGRTAGKTGWVPGYAGIRPKLGSAGSLSEDFVIQSADEHGVAGLINLFGIESPGLTSCLAIADEVMARLGLNELEYEK